MEIKKQITIEFTGTIQELKQLLLDTFNDDRVIVSCSIRTDGAIQSLPDPLYQSFIDFCSELYPPLHINNKSVAHTGLYDAKHMANSSPVNAIKKIRQVTGMDLKDAKDFVNKHLRDNIPEGTAHC
jgi:hypothetical protein